MTSARRLYRVSSAAAIMAAAVVAAAVVAALSSVDLAASPRELAMSCRRLLAPGGIAALAILILLGVSVVVVGRGTRSLLRQLRAQRRFFAELGQGEPGRVVGVDLRLIGTERPLAFCAGILRPRIYISSGTLASLSADEAHAVVAHEQHHCKRRDPLRLLCARTVADAMFFLPVLDRLAGRYAALAELAADEAAVAVARPKALASALLRFGDLEPDAAIVGIAPERVDYLLGEPARWQVALSVAAGSVLVAIGIAALAFTLSAGSLGTSVGLPVLLSEACMVVMTAGPLALAAGGLLASRRLLSSRV